MVSLVSVEALKTVKLLGIRLAQAPLRRAGTT